MELPLRPGRRRPRAVRCLVPRLARGWVGRRAAWLSIFGFPVWPKSSALERETEVYAIRPGGRPKAYPISLVLEKGVINDSVGDLQLVVVGHPESGTVRVYERRGLTFRPGPSPDLLRDESDRTWRLTEAALVVDSSAGDLMSLARVPGHVSFWFAWYGFFPHTELYPPPGGHATEPQ